MHGELSIRDIKAAGFLVIGHQLDVVVLGQFVYRGNAQEDGVEYCRSQMGLRGYPSRTVYPDK